MSQSVDELCQRATARLLQVSDTELDHLSTDIVALLLLYTPPVAALHSLRRRLALRLQRDATAAWIGSADLGGVFCALSALWQYDQKSVSGDQLSAAVQRLLWCEVAPGGPYRQTDVPDLAANTFIALFAHLAIRPLPQLERWLAQAVAHNPAIVSAQPVVGELLARLAVIDHALLARLPQTPAHQSVLLKYDRQPSRAKIILSSDWPPQQLLAAQPASSLATAAFILGNLSAGASPPSNNTQLEQQHAAVIQATRQLFAAQSKLVRLQAEGAIDRIAGSESAREITLFAAYFARSLNTPPALSGGVLTLLGSASVCGWIAYTILDDFLDGEGVPSQLPLATAAFRLTLDCFSRAPAPGAFRTIVAASFARMDAANAWEASSCRFVVQGDKVAIKAIPTYGRRSVLADRSYAHMLGPLLVMTSVVPLHSKAGRHVQAGLRHYLIARQLHDDLRDWRADMHAGIASAVVVALLRGSHVRPGTYQTDGLLRRMQRHLDTRGMGDICRCILDHIAHARQHLASSQLLRTESDIGALLDRLEELVHLSLDQHAKAQLFKRSVADLSAGNTQPPCNLPAG